MSTWKKKIRDLLIILVISIALLGVAELGMRVFIRLAAGQWFGTRLEYFHSQVTASLRLLREHPFLNITPQEGARVAVFGKEIAFNSLGYRSPDRPLEKPEDVVRVLCSGGSTTLDILADNGEGSWPWILEKNLSEDFTIETWVSALQGWSSMENVISLHIRDVELKPDIIVLFQGINDLRAASYRPFDPQYEGHAHQLREVVGLNLKPLTWYQRSVLVERILGLFIEPKDPHGILGIRPGEGRYPTLEEAGISAYERNIRSFIAIGRGHDADMILATQPLRIREEFADEDMVYVGGMFPGLKPSNAPRELEKLNDVLRKLAQEEGVGLADSVKHLGFDDSHFGDPMHFSPQGSQRFADFLAAIIATRLNEPSPVEEPPAEVGSS